MFCVHIRCAVVVRTFLVRDFSTVLLFIFDNQPIVLVLLKWNFNLEMAQRTETLFRLCGWPSRFCAAGRLRGRRGTVCDGSGCVGIPRTNVLEQRGCAIFASVLPRRHCINTRPATFHALYGPGRGRLHVASIGCCRSFASTVS